MVGKYTNLSDAYLSVIKALQHACLAANRKLNLVWIDAEKLEDPSKVRPSRVTSRRWKGMSGHGEVVKPTMLRYPYSVSVQ
jgi:CTP synthase